MSYLMPDKMIPAGGGQSNQDSLTYEVNQPLKWFIYNESKRNLGMMLLWKNHASPFLNIMHILLMLPSIVPF